MMAGGSIVMVLGLNHWMIESVDFCPFRSASELDLIVLLEVQQLY